MKKIVNIKVKASLKPLLRTKKIDFRYLKSYRPAKKDKNKANWEH